MEEEEIGRRSTSLLSRGRCSGQHFANNPDAWVALFLENHDSPPSILSFVSGGSVEKKGRSGTGSSSNSSYLRPRDLPKGMRTC